MNRSCAPHDLDMTGASKHKSTDLHHKSTIVRFSHFVGLNGLENNSENCDKGFSQKISERHQNIQGQTVNHRFPA